MGWRPIRSRRRARGSWDTRTRPRCRSRYRRRSHPRTWRRPSRPRSRPAHPPRKRPSARRPSQRVLRRRSSRRRSTPSRQRASAQRRPRRPPRPASTLGILPGRSNRPRRNRASRACTPGNRSAPTNPTRSPIAARAIPSVQTSGRQSIHGPRRAHPIVCAPHRLFHRREALGRSCLAPPSPRDPCLRGPRTRPSPIGREPPPMKWQYSARELPSSPRSRGRRAASGVRRLLRFSGTFGVKAPPNGR
jgi:hypothetical protein